MALDFIDHKPVCLGDKTCKECGRRGCYGCICENDIHPVHLLGKCIICAGIHKESGVSLYPVCEDWDR